MTENILERARDIHSRNVTAGWWSDLKTGDSILLTRNRPEMLMLVVSELSEANEGLLTGANDDKLTHLPMFPVELADAAIRLLDLIGAEEAVHGSVMVGDGSSFNLMVEELLGGYRDNRQINDLMGVVDLVSAAMEHYRKSRIHDYRWQLVRCLAGVFALAWCREADDLWPTIDAKLAFNASRADHKIENRLAPGGKQF